MLPKDTTELTYELMTEKLIKAWSAHGELLDLLSDAWGIIANAGGGDWTTQTKQWQRAATQWRDDYHALAFLKKENENV